MRRFFAAPLILNAVFNCKSVGVDGAPGPGWKPDAAAVVVLLVVDLDAMCLLLLLLNSITGGGGRKMDGWSMFALIWILLY